ncbi:MAG: NUDIX domain-containing protein [Saccharofermentans sp.]|nr:NUDIX domain-containing protein [Saccharofermentans sp.]
MEILDIVDINGEPTGKTVTREEAHLRGTRHRTSHVWILRRKETVQVLLQKRSLNKESYPGMWDISSAGHIPAGKDWVESALRELSEELGIEAKPEDLKEAGLIKVTADTTFHGKPFKDNQVSKVFILIMDKDESCFTVQKEELSEVKWFDLDKLIDDVDKGLMGDCIIPDELRLVRRAYKEQ